MKKIKDLSGKRFGKLTVIKRADDHVTKYGNKVKTWECLCDCGNTAIIPEDSLYKNGTKSCGCLRLFNGGFIDIAGQKFGKLSVIEIAERKKGKILWRCKCDCGNEVVALGENIRSGTTKSCGCLIKENGTKIAPKVTKHGGSYTRIYRIYCGMKKRCLNPSSDAYHHYGGRGIKICNEWLGDDGFETFREWALSHGYEENLSIDRINNDGDYCPENCRWADKETQSNNTSSNLYLEYNGEVHTASEWSRILEISYTRLTKRVGEGERIEDIVNNPSKVYMERENAEIRKILRKEKIMQKEIAEKIGIKSNTLSRWMNKTLTSEREERIKCAIQDILLERKRSDDHR